MISEIQTLLTICLQALPVWIVLRAAWLMLRRPRRRPRLLREAALGLFAVFMAGVL